jgi:ribosome modulation factor
MGVRMAGKAEVLLAAVLVALLGSAAGAQPATREARGPGFETGRLQAVRKECADVIALKIDGTRLAVDREHWDRAAEHKSPEQRLKELTKEYTNRGMPRQTAERLARSALRKGTATGLEGAVRRLKTAVIPGGSSRSSGMGGWRESFHGDGLSVIVASAGRELHVTLVEEGAPHRLLRFFADGGNIRLVLSSAESGFLLLVSQTDGGGFRVLEHAGGEVFRAEADSFAAFCRTHRQYVTKRLLPLLSHNGVGVPLTPYGDEVKRKVLLLLRESLSAEAQQKAKSLIARLGDPSYARRQEATKLLMKDMERYRWHLLRAAKDATLSPEAAARVRKLLEQHRPARDLDAAVADFGLLADALFLAELLSETKDEGDRKRIAGRLREITGRDFGTDAAKWKAHLESRKGDEAPK